MSNEVAEKPKLVEIFAERYNVEPNKVLQALKQTAFRQQGNNEISNEQMMALMIVANEYKLNPFTKEIYAYPDKGSIVPVVSVDGWSRIMNSHPEMDGIEFQYAEETVEHKGHTCYQWIDCSIYRKDRSRPITVREFFDEVVRTPNFTSPWDTHPNRMHRHKAQIQCARIAFGFAGIYDQDEAERILDGSYQPSEPELQTVSQHTKEYFDSLIEESDSLRMYCFAESLDNAQYTNLYHSFEKGSKGKYQKIVDELVSKGRNQVEDYVLAIEEAAEKNDSGAVAELVEELPTEAMEILEGKLSQDAAAILKETTNA